MALSPATKLWASALGIMLLCAAPAQAEQLFSPVQQRSFSLPELLQKLSRSQVVYLGETHDRAADHQAQLQILQALHRQNPKIAIALEMFQRPYQSVLDQYLAGQISEDELRQQSQYDQRWGFSWELYAPILRFAQAQKLSVLALNTPTEITRKVAREGWSSLTPEEQKWIPPESEVRTDNAAYRQKIQEFYDQMHQGKSSSRSFERFFLAQVLWDETMADRIAQFLQTHPNHQVVVLAGQGHIAYGYGIPDRVARRVNAQKKGRSLRQTLILLSPPSDYQPNPQNPVADYLWQTP